MTTLGPGNDSFTGTTGNDSILAGDGNDTVLGIDGGDTILGEGGADLLLGDLPGEGNDSLSGGAANDTMFGGNGVDTLDGGDGDDQLFGEPGSDVVNGGAGNDTAFAGDGNDSMTGGDGRDFFIADAGNDTIALGEGDDVGFGGDGADSVAGGNGNDFLFGDAGADSLRGEAGDDRLHADGDDLLVDGGDGGFDVLVPIAGLTAIDLSNAANQNAGGSGPTITGMEAVDASLATAGISITGAAFNGLGNVLFGGTAADTITGSSLADVILGNAGADSIAGGGGNDTLIADAGNDSIDGGLGDDTVLLLGNPADWTQDTQGGVTTFTNATTGQVVALRNVQSVFFDGDQSTLDLPVTDVNAPPVAADASFSLAENSANGTAVGTATATDPDDGDVVTFAITAGNGLGGFAIDSVTGAISVADTAVLDFETNPAFALTVTATDSGGNTDTAAVAVTLTDVDDGGGNQPPVASDASFTIAENSANGTAVGTATATDPDAGDSVSFAIAAGNDLGGFAIDSVTGAISVADVAVLDFETNPAFSLTVVATDEGGLTDSATVAIDLTDVDEGGNLPPAVDDQVFAVDENSSNGTNVGIIAASDPESGTLTYAIAGGTGQAIFAIDSSSGQIAVSDGSQLDFEGGTTSYTLTVTVTDDATATDSATVTVNVNDVVEGPGGNPPVAVDDTGFVSNATAAAFPAIALLLNDSDADGDPLAVTAVANGAGLAAGPALSDGEIAFLTGETDASFDYTVSDGTATDTGSVTITVVTTTAGDDSPTAATAADQASYIDAKAGADTVTGGEGIDIFLGGDGNDSLVGGNGTDNLAGGNDNDTLTGADGNDSLDGDSGVDLLLGGNGDDSVAGSDGDDVINGEDGVDTLEGGNGADSLAGGDGADFFAWFDPAEFGDTLSDYDAGTDTTTVDTLRFGQAGVPIGNGDAVVDNFAKGNDAAINVAGSEIGVKTDASVATAAIQTTIDGYAGITGPALFVFHDSTLGNAAIYRDADPSAAGGATLVTELDNIVNLADLANFDAGDFDFSVLS